jgi:flavin reductase (DIM6/NTAB) family NADH-FMN oxidoreductase RutF
MVFFSCKVIGSHVYGDHTIYLGEVKEVRQQGEGVPLMFYLSRWYHPTQGGNL